MTPETVTLLLQIPLAGVVVFVVMLFMKFLEKYLDKLFEFIKQQNLENQNFLKSEQGEWRKVFETLAKEVYAMQIHFADFQRNYNLLNTKNFKQAIKKKARNV